MSTGAAGDVGGVAGVTRAIEISSGRVARGETLSLASRRAVRRATEGGFGGGAGVRAGCDASMDGYACGSSTSRTRRPALGASVAG